MLAKKTRGKHQKIYIQCGSDYPSTTQVVSHVAMSGGSGQLPWRSVDVYLWWRAIPLCREYNNTLTAKQRIRRKACLPPTKQSSDVN